ncbi:MAG TPA: S8 family peptidase [Bacteriovoracaceae bacterium]|nr:S8 family peptidase [Bacteriovoracaceae bacterium]
MKTLLIALTLCSSMAHAARFVVEASIRPQASGDMKVEAFYPTKHDYFSSLFVISGNITKEEIQKLAGVKLVEEAFEISKLSLIPADSTRRIVSDELFAYQWGLTNQGQTYLREKDDIHNLPMKGVVGKDIGWEALLAVPSTKRPIVAVLDSGVDLEHPELKNNLWKNEGECGKDPKVDNDGNKLAGDCNGWNFTEEIASDEAKNPNDIDGHGTHVAGIIAASMDGVGIVGVVPNALIMPIKVMKDSNSKSEVASSEAFARGIIYAVDNGAQVINMSLGWPRSMETKFLREAVFYALGQGVVIVAAAGNNNSTEPLYPCAYEGVVCVAASTLNGSFAGFSNYGGHVDVVAPGEAILSTHPIVFEPEFFAVPGYEIRSGTSQSAPFVTGLVASLLAERPKMKIDEVLARIYQLPKAKDPKKYVLGGEATYTGLSASVEAPVVRPILKRIRQILIRGTESKIIIPVRNFGITSGDLEVSVESLSKALTVKTEAQVIKPLEQGSAFDVPFELSVDDFTMESNVAIKITIKEGENTHSYINEIPVMRDIMAEYSFLKVPFSFVEKPLPVGGVKNGEISSNLTTVESYGNTPKHDLYLRRIIKDGDKRTLEITLFSREGNKFQQAPKVILVNNALNLVNFIRVDLNQDGSEDYMVQTLCEKDTKKFFTFSFYNSKMETLWTQFQDVVLNVDIYLQRMNDLAFTRLDHPGLGKMMVPAFFTEGQLPKIDQVLTSWDRVDMGKKKRLYYLEPREKTFIVRALTNGAWVDAVKKELKTKWYDTVEAEQLLPASLNDIKNGTLRVMVTVGLTTKRKLSIYTFTPKTNTHGPILPQLVLQTEEVDPLLGVTEQGLQVVGDVYFNIYDRERSKIVTTKDQVQEGEYVYRHKTDTDLIAGHLATFSMDNKKFSVIQTREELISISRGSSEKISKRAKLRYSFLSQRLLSEMYLPVIYQRDGVLAPALYVDATAVTGNRISLFEEQSGSLVSSIKNSISVPANCKSLNPVQSVDSGANSFVFLCQEGNQWMIRTFKMN